MSDVLQVLMTRYIAMYSSGMAVCKIRTYLCEPCGGDVSGHLLECTTGQTESN